MREREKVVRGLVRGRAEGRKRDKQTLLSPELNLGLQLRTLAEITT